MYAKLEFSRKLKDEKSEIDVSSKMLTIGRAENCNVEISDKYVSGHHCSLEFCDDGKIYLTDSSSNGTFVDDKRVKNGRIEVAFGSIVYLIRKPNEPEKNLYFTIKCPEFKEDLNETAIYSPFETLVADEKTGRKTEDETQQLNNESKESDTLDVEFLGEGFEEPSAKKPRLTRVSIASAGEIENVGVKQKPEEPVVSSPPPTTSSSNQQEKNAMAEILLCSICCEIIHDCISLQPCTHCFCAACYSDWMPRSRHCPECRVKVERIAKNHRINNLIEAYLQEHPDKKRPDAELKEMDEKNKITRDMIYPKKQKGVSDAANADEGSDDSSSYYSSTDLDDDDDDQQQNVGVMGNFNPANVFPRPFIPYVPQVQLPLPRCIQCQNYQQVPPIGGVYLRPAARVPPNFVCGPLQNHVICLCCHNPMPDRRQDKNCPAVMECFICKRPYCNLYFGCTAAGCNGCLNKFKDMNFGGVALANIINENYYESQIFLDYLKGKNITREDLLKDCLAKLDNGEYACRDKFAHALTSETVLCVTCALNNFRDLTYEYRKNVPKEDLPAHVTSRPDCWYGRNCRTQKNNPGHAAKLNHICDQTRF